MDGFIDGQIARANRNLLLSGLILAAIVVGVGAVAGRYYLNYFGGPYPATLESIAHGDDGHDYVAVDGELTDTGFQHITKQINKYSREERSRDVTGAYYTIGQGDKVLLARIDNTVRAASASTTSGWLRAPDDVDRQVRVKLLGEHGELGAKLLPGILDATQTRRDGTIGLVALAVVLFLALRSLFLWARRRGHREDHPIWRQLADAGEPNTLAAQIDEEVARPDVARIGTAILTKSWLLNRWLFGLRVIPYDRLVWCHKKITRHNFIVKTYEAVIHARDGKGVAVRGKQAVVDGLLKEVLARAPWVIAGYSPELARAWARDRDAMIAKVDERRLSRPPAPGG
jgi:hypothetical protein